MSQSSWHCTVSSAVLHILTFLLVRRKWYNWALILEVSPQSWLQAATDPCSRLLRDGSAKIESAKTLQTGKVPPYAPADTLNISEWELLLYDSPIRV